ncbi:venom carboxylesterase-6-like [Maniola jurtina]|uniref:venom carboxylesterase-6-like n=1 Tax=Maniola jurtina TaxID=191418 RepID=UPI001E68F615|nr:venom carboxylesterase-6-like [Maniola jurtina]
MAPLNFLLSLLLVTAVTSEDPIVQVSKGSLQGIWRVSTNGRNFASFLGIPYAQPPIGRNKFKEPQAIKSWTGVKNATTVPSACLQFDPFSNTVLGNEDCLFLNIHTPDPSEDALLPVVVFIHGGGFLYGAGGQYDAVHLMDRDVIVVTFNYRLGPLGFLSTGDDQIPGNTGLKDQSFALKWVQDNIIKFGGDPYSITLMGSSAGAASVHYHYLSPLSKGTFHRGFASSGSAFVPWAYDTKPAEKAEALAAIIGCPTTDTSEMANCLKNKSGEDIVTAQIQMFEWSQHWFSLFAPTAEAPGTKKPFLTQHPYIATEAGAMQPVPLIACEMAYEGLYPGAIFQANPELLTELESNWEHLASNIFKYSDTLPVDLRASVAEKIRQEYLDGKPVGLDTFTGLVEALGDRLLKDGDGKLAYIHAQKTLAPTYVYRFAYRWQYSLTNIMAGNDNNYGTSHGDDIMLFFRYGVPDATRPEDVRMRDIFLDMIYSFASTGVPELTDGPEWLEVSPGEPEVNYLDITGPDDIEMKSTADFGHKVFWDNLGFNENENFCVSN